MLLPTPTNLPMAILGNKLFPPEAKDLLRKCDGGSLRR